MTRQYGHGSLYQRQDGRWIGRLPDGRGGHRYVTGTDRDDVERRLEAARKERDRTRSGSGRGGERLRDLFRRYLDDIAPVRTRPRTIEGYRQLAEAHIIPAIGSIRVAQLDARDAQKLVNTMTAGGYSPTTIAHAIAALSVVLRHAQREGLTDRNVARLAVLPKQDRRKLPSLTTEQVGAFLDATRGEPLWPVWVLCATTGMRVSEVLGLRWADVGPGTVTVSGQYRRVRRGPYIEYDRVEPKTEKSRRTLYLPALARDAMTVAKAEARSAVLVFARRDGQPMDRSTVTKAFAASLTRHGFPSVRLHSLRHSAAVAMLEASGGNVWAVSNTLGHASLAITTDVYAKEAADARRQGMEAMDKALERRTK